MKKDLEIGPQLINALLTGDVEHMLEHSHHPRRHTRYVCHIPVNGCAGNTLHLLLKITQQGNLLLRNAENIHQQTAVLYEYGAQIAHKAAWQVVVGRMAAAQNKPLACQQAAAGVAGHIYGDNIIPTLVVHVVQACLRNGDKLALVIGCARRLCKPLAATFPKHILHTMAHAVNIGLERFIVLKAYRSSKLFILPDGRIVVPYTPLGSRSLAYKTSQHSTLYCLGMRGIFFNCLDTTVEKRTC